MNRVNNVNNSASMRATILEPVEMTGVGLHSGKPVRMRLRPAASGTGVVFRVGEGAAARDLPASVAAIGDARNATTLARNGVQVATVEHLLAALAMQRVDDVVVELDNGEPPAADGSAAPFVKWLAAAGLREQGAPRQVVKILEEVAIRDGARSISIAPAEVFGVEYEIEFDAPAVGKQALALPRLDAATFRDAVAGARTFGFLADVDRLRAAGLALGGSLANTLVVDGDRVLNETGLRWPDEFVRHKVLDLIGDLALLGAPLVGRVQVRRGGHALHHALLRALEDRASAWRFV